MLLKKLLGLSLLLAVLMIGGRSKPATESRAPDSPPDSSTAGQNDDGQAAPVEGQEMEEWSIVISVGGGEPITFTSADALEIGAAEIEAAQKDKDTVGEKQVWTGLPLKDILAYAGVTDFTVVAVESVDGYSREYEPDIVNSDGTGIGWMVDGKPLEEDDGPVALFVDQKGPKWWIKQVSKITVIP